MASRRPFCRLAVFTLKAFRAMILMINDSAIYEWKTHVFE